MGVLEKVREGIRIYIRGLQFYTFFGISIGIKRWLIDNGKMFENVQIFSHLHLKYAKSAIMTQKILFLKNINMGI